MRLACMERAGRRTAPAGPLPGGCRGRRWRRTQACTPCFSPNCAPARTTP